MSEQLEVTPEAMEALAVRRAERRTERRAFFEAFGPAAGLTGAAYMAAGAPALAQAAPTSEQNVLNFALNLEYLEAQFYSYAATGAGLPDSILGGTGTRGPVRPGRQVPFSDPVVREYAREIFADERAHVVFLRQALGAVAVAQPEIDVSVSPTSAFSAAARAAGLITAGQSFDVYANDENFLLGAYIFEDVGVTAYKGSSAALINNKTFLDAAAGILAVEAYHAANIRASLSRRGIATPSLIDATEAISNARDAVDGASDIDQGVRRGQAPTLSTALAPDTANVAPTDANGLAFSRTPGQVLNVVYLNRATVSAGGFFPQGVNGTIRASAAN